MSFLQLLLYVHQFGRVDRMVIGRSKAFDAFGPDILGLVLFLALATPNILGRSFGDIFDDKLIEESRAGAVVFAVALGIAEQFGHVPERAPALVLPDDEPQALIALKWTHSVETALYLFLLPIEHVGLRDVAALDGSQSRFCRLAHHNGPRIHIAVIDQS